LKPDCEEDDDTCEKCGEEEGLKPCPEPIHVKPNPDPNPDPDCVDCPPKPKPPIEKPEPCDIAKIKEENE